MNASKKPHALIVLATTLVATFALCVNAADKPFSGEWESVESMPGSSKVYSTFDLKLIELDDGTVQGSYCFVTQGGNRIDCDPDGAKNITGRVSENGHQAEVYFYSFFGAKDGVAELAIKDGTLTWVVTKRPSGDFFYGPYKESLDIKQSKVQSNDYKVMAERAYLYNSPAESNGAKTYVVKGDHVKLISVSSDLSFWKIQYAEQNGTVIERWIDCHAINYCP